MTPEPEKNTSPKHPYQRLQLQLAQLIHSVPAGDKLPSEPDLAKQMGVSRATLREAMRAFEGQGLIRRRQGVGTFVAGQAHVLESGLEVLESIETMAQKISLDVSVGDLDVRQIPATPEQGVLLQIEAGATLVQISRVILAENRPVAFLVDVLPQDVLSKEDLKNGFTGSVLDFLLKRGEPALSGASTTLVPEAAQAEIARALEIQRSDVLLSFTATLYTTTGRVVDLSSSYFLPGYFKFHVVRRLPGEVHQPVRFIDLERKVPKIYDSPVDPVSPLQTNSI